MHSIGSGKIRNAHARDIGPKIGNPWSPPRFWLEPTWQLTNKFRPVNRLNRKIQHNQKEALRKRRRCQSANDKPKEILEAEEMFLHKLWKKMAENERRRERGRRRNKEKELKEKWSIEGECFLKPINLINWLITREMARQSGVVMGAHGVGTTWRISWSERRERKKSIIVY